MKAFVIEPNATVRVVQEDRFTLDVLRELVGGDVEPIALPDMGVSAFINEESKIHGLEPNPLATALWRDSFLTVDYGPLDGDYLAGPVVIYGGVDSDGECVGLTDDQINTLIDAGLTRLHFMFDK